jgi:endonuclease/exonuclease/phosphatase family metal-dependent hydrolase
MKHFQTVRRGLPSRAFQLRLLPGALLVVVVCSASLPAQTPAKPLQLRLGSWNIEHLGDPGARRGTGEGVLQQPQDLARYIRYANVDILALQEIVADDDGPEGYPKKYRTNSILTKAFAELSKTGGQAWKHILFPKMRTADTTQWVGVAWNANKVRQVGPIYQVPVNHARTSQDSNRWDRNLHALMFSAGKDLTDIVMLPIHLKANASASFARHRGEEIDEFVKHLPDLHKTFPGEKDFIVLGDTNIQNAGEPAVKALEQTGFMDLNKSDLDTHTAKGIQPFDRFFVPKGQPEFARSNQEVLAAFQKKQNLSFAEFRARYSDHYVAVTSILVMPDDD